MRAVEARHINFSLTYLPKLWVVVNVSWRVANSMYLQSPLAISHGMSSTPALTIAYLEPPTVAICLGRLRLRLGWVM